MNTSDMRHELQTLILRNLDDLVNTALNDILEGQMTTQCLDGILQQVIRESQGAQTIREMLEKEVCGYIDEHLDEWADLIERQATHWASGDRGHVIPATSAQLGLSFSHVACQLLARK
jgi:AraC-like DNA-binding protein